MNIGFMGGSFDPPHLGHLNAAKVFYTEAHLDKLIIIPAKVSPFKADDGHITCDKCRFDMSVLCFDTLQKKYGYNVEVSPIEMEKDNISYTYLTVNELLVRYPDSHFTMYVGSDTFLSLEKWKNVNLIFEKCSIYTRSRMYGETSELLEAKERYEKLFNAKITISNAKEVIVSSTYTRSSIAAKKFDICENLLTEDVLRYIIKNKLYCQE